MSTVCNACILNVYMNYISSVNIPKMCSRSWFRVLKKKVCGSLVIYTVGTHHWGIERGLYARCHLLSSLWLQERGVWFMAGKFSWTLGVLLSQWDWWGWSDFYCVFLAIGMLSIAAIEMLVAVLGFFDFLTSPMWRLKCSPCTRWITTPSFQAVCGGLQPTTVHQLTQYDDISVDNFTSQKLFGSFWPQ